LLGSRLVFCAVFTYWVEDAEAFERVYGPDGEWAAFFRGGEGYLGTELLASDGGRYLLIDRWASRAAYEAFLAAHGEEYERRSAETAALYVREEKVGEFETAP
jgi:heme-degrading monooxygenase HmoA